MVGVFRKPLMCENYWGIGWKVLNTDLKIFMIQVLEDSWWRQEYMQRVHTHTHKNIESKCICKSKYIYE